MNIFFVYLIIFSLVVAATYAEFYHDKVEHRPNRNQRWPANFLLMIINSSLLSAIPISTIAFAELASSKNTGLLNLIELPLFIDVIVTISVLTLLGYAIHRMFHQIPILWRLHRVHHSDTVIDGSSGFRHHPCEPLISTVIYACGAFLFGLEPITVIIVSFLELLFALLTHCTIRLPLGLERWLTAVLITPRLHEIHHSNYVKETDSNFGSFLTIWDHLFGTFLFQPRRKKSEFKVGVKEVNQNQACNFEFLLTSPLLSLKPEAELKTRNDNS